MCLIQPGIGAAAEEPRQDGGTLHGPGDQRSMPSGVVANRMMTLGQMSAGRQVGMLSLQTTGKVNFAYLMMVIFLSPTEEPVG